MMFEKEKKEEEFSFDTVYCVEMRGCGRSERGLGKEFESLSSPSEMVREVVMMLSILSVIHLLLVV